MILALLVIALVAIVLLYAERRSQKDKIKQQNYHIRHLTGNLDDSDRNENKNLADDFHFAQILRALKDENKSYASLGNSYFIQEAQIEFKRKYGYPFADPFNKYDI